MLRGQRVHKIRNPKFEKLAYGGVGGGVSVYPFYTSTDILTRLNKRYQNLQKFQQPSVFLQSWL